MFTGIIQSVGQLHSIQKNANDCRLRISVGSLNLSDVGLGDSVAVNGVCLTAVAIDSKSFTADVSNETLSKTTLGKLKQQDHVNLEKALTLSTPLGGHLVSGHVDGVGKIIKRYKDGASERFEIETPAELSKYIAQKGSICIDGISLTVNAINACLFELNIVPHTLSSTTMNSYQVGRLVNIEVDQIARYIERLLLSGASDKADDVSRSAKQTLNKGFLAENGFL